ncbi:MAG: 3'-5' exonuclease [Thermotogaceae bacterium]|nr:3'-5' exonuclease [Thermotogaceae bacterium]
MDWNETVFCAIDTETTGINPESGDRIIEVAIVPVFQGKLILEKAYVTLINPGEGIVIPANTEKVHGISNETIKMAPSMRDVFPVIQRYMKELVPVFHNGKFDLMFFDYAAKDVGEFPVDPYYIDTQDLSKEVFGAPKTLEWLAKYFSITDRINHRALDDAIVTAQVFIELANMIGVENVSEFIKKWNGAPV